ncbi:hypothetical protein [Variovorax sp. EBFNA2]|uniref:hypothetical protein n=1 Tax=Variovorax sp. EBFNA2 TaxID=3342097 RepID=UPI0029BFCE82|nr:hypothetical protein [Variovorax boronicumulans]WPG35158.1 hypothetical protein RZE79_16835 [Variovorax boronicumulans]
MSILQALAATCIVIALYGWGATVDGANRLTDGAVSAVASTACSGLQAARYSRAAP